MLLHVQEEARQLLEEEQEHSKTDHTDTDDEEASVPPSRRALLIDSGQPSTTAMFPWMAMVVRPGSEKYLCGGTVIHPRCRLRERKEVAVASCLS